MALKIIRTGEPVPVETLNVFLYGQPGTGKTSVGYTFRRPLVLDFDNGAHRSRQHGKGTTVRIENWGDVSDLMRSDLIGQHDTIVVDTVGRALDYAGVWLVEQNPKLGTSRGLSLQGYGELKGLFTNWVKALNTRGKTVVFIAHDREDKSGDEVLHRPDVTGGSYAEVMKVADFVGFVHRHAGGVVLGFNPNGAIDYVAKDSARLGNVAVPDLDAVPDFGAQLLEQMFGAFVRETTEHRDRAELTHRWGLVVQNVDTLDDVRDAQELAREELQGQPESVRRAVGKLLHARALELGFQYDRETREYYDPNPKPEPLREHGFPPDPEPEPPKAKAKAKKPAPDPEPAPAEATAPRVDMNTGEVLDFQEPGELFPAHDTDRNRYTNSKEAKP